MLTRFGGSSVPVKLKQVTDSTAESYYCNNNNNNNNSLYFIEGNTFSKKKKANLP